MRYYSKRELYALGETLGDSVTERKVGGGRIYGGGGKGGGGGGPTQTTGTTYQTNIPEYAQPYVETMLGATQKQLFQMDDSGAITGFSPYKPYSSRPEDYVAPFSPMQQQAQRGVGNLTLPGTFKAGSDISGLAAMGGMGLAGQQAQAGQNYQNQATSMYGPGSVGDYMNPYIAQSLAPQLQQLNQQFGIKGAQEQGAATSAGAFGGSRNALMQGLNQQNQMLAQQQAIGQGYDKAFQAAQQAQQFGANLGLQGQSAAQQGLGQATQAAGQMAGIGNQALEAQKGIYGAQATAGAQQQAQQQQMINQAITDYANAQQYPLMQLGTMSNMLRGLPMQSQSTNQYVAAPNPVTQGIGLAGAGASIYNALGGGKPAGSKAGGVVGMAKGGIASYRGGDLINETENDLYDMPVENLQKELKSPSPTIRRMAERIIREKTGKAGGGIIAFANSTDENNQSLVNSRIAPVGGVILDQGENKDPNYIPRELRYNAEAIKAPMNQVPSKLQFDPKAVERESRNFIPPELRADYDKLATDNKTLAMQQGAVPKPRQMGLSDAPMTNEERIAGFKAALEGKVNPKSIVAAAPAADPNANLPPMPTNVKADSLGRTDANKQGPAPAAAPAGNGSVGIKPNTGLAPNIGGIKLPVAPVPETQAELDKGAAERVAAYGVNEGIQKDRARLMGEKANTAEENRRATALRMAEFFGAWGSTPGNTIVAGLNALKNKMPDFIGDIKEEAKIRRQIDKDIAELDKLDREEKNGIKKDYFAERAKLADRAMHIYGYQLTAYSSAQQTAAYRDVGAARAAGAGGETKQYTALSKARSDIEGRITARIKELGPMVETYALMPDSKDPKTQERIIMARAKAKDATKDLTAQRDEVQSVIDRIRKIDPNHGLDSAVNPAAAASNRAPLGSFQK